MKEDVVLYIFSNWQMNLQVNLLFMLQNIAKREYNPLNLFVLRSIGFTIIIIIIVITRLNVSRF